MLWYQYDVTLWKTFLHLQNRFTIMHCTEYVVNMQKHFRYNLRPISTMQSKTTSYRLPYLDSAVIIIRKAAQTHQVSFKADNRNVRHAEKFYTARVVRVWVICNQQGQLKAFMNLLLWRRLWRCNDVNFQCLNELHDLLYNQCIDNMCCYSFFIYPMGRIRVCMIRFVSAGEYRKKHCPVWQIFFRITD